MRITDVKLLTLELPEEVPAREFNLVQVPNLWRIQYTHKRTGRMQKERTHFRNVSDFVDAGVDVLNPFAVSTG